MRNALFCTLSLLALGAAAQAQNATTPPAGDRREARPQQSVEERFKLLDTNKDGKLSQAEYVAGGNVAGANAGGGTGAGGNQRQGQPTVSREERFKAMDTNKDGSVSLDEYKASRSNMGPGGQRQGRRGQRT